MEKKKKDSKGLQIMAALLLAGLFWAGVGYAINMFLADESVWRMLIEMTIIRGGVMCAGIGAVWSMAAAAGWYFNWQINPTLPMYLIVAATISGVATVMLVMGLVFVGYDLIEEWWGIWLLGSGLGLMIILSVVAMFLAAARSPESPKDIMDRIIQTAIQAGRVVKFPSKKVH
jgi:hypothetical protein